MKTFSMVFLLALQAVFAMHASCQVRYLPAYIITNENDTVTGLAGYRSKGNASLCLFRTGEDAETTEYRPFEIKAYRFIDGEYYVSKKVTLDGESSDLFLEYLVDGIASLYYYLDNVGDHYLLETQDGTMYKLENTLIKSDATYYTDHSYYESKRYIGILKASFSDCPEIQNDLNSARLEHKSLIRLTSEYHDYVCSTEECIIYSKKGPAAPITFAPVIGYHMTSFMMADNQYYEGFGFERSGHMDYGLRINLPLPFLNGNTSFDISPSLGSFAVNGHMVDESAAYMEYHDLSIEARYFETLLSYKYLFVKKDFRPGLFVGLGWMKVGKTDLFRTLRVEDGSTVLNYDHEGDIPLPASFISFHGGFELNYSLGKRSALFIDVLYLYYRGIYDTNKSPTLPNVSMGDKVKSIMQNVSLKAGIYF